MHEGLWTVEFVSSNRFGRGVLIITADKLLGGDDGFYYSGSWNKTGNNFDATITVIKYNPNAIAVFGNIDHFQINLRGQIDEYQFNAIGTIVNNPQAQMKIIGTKKVDL
jgi:hypothetical protein